ncbi:unnamed protein product [Periconia digitata]|uniref:Zn(2)-C6 fungal-type domain-containing protein n=1 Tax=Periconia digitata TaxID=1303443 RepID=A0A9W4UVL2_9PLEO|nr:unnamed protein product [Periconia digitata]
MRGQIGRGTGFQPESRPESRYNKPQPFDFVRLTLCAYGFHCCNTAICTMNPLISEPKNSAAYGHACSNCVKAKCKCIPRGDDNSCERCHRLAKDCHPSTSFRKRTTKRANSQLSKTSQLEDKLDNLVSLLQAQNAPHADSTSSHPPHAQTSSAHLPSHHVKPQCLLRPVPYPPSPSNTNSSSPHSQLSSCDPSEIIRSFKDRFQASFPYIHIPEDQPIEKFLQERPLTFQAIATLCDFVGESQIVRAKCIREQIALRVVVEGERSLDLLYATLTATVWHVYFSHAKPSGGMFSSICGVLVKDLRLIKRDGSICAPKMPPLYEIPEPKEILSDDERRAVLTYFIISTTYSAYLNYPPWRWSPYLDEACRGLMLNDQILGDRVLVALARTFKIAFTAAKVIKNVSETDSQISHALMQVKPLRTMLDELEKEIAPEVMENRTVRSSFHSTSVLVSEAVLVACSAFAPNASPALDPDINLQCITTLTTCLHSCKSALNSYVDMRFDHMNMSMIFSWMHVMHILFKLSVLDFPNWDRALMRATADPLYYFSRTITMLKTAHEELKELSGSCENIFTKAPDIMKAKIGIWKEHLENHDAATAATAMAMPGGMTSSAMPVGGLGQDAFNGNNLAMGFDVMDTSWLNFQDDMFFSNIFSQ